MKIKLSSTSFLLPKNKSWEHLSNLKDISFSEYGDIFSNMSKLKKAKKYDIEFFMIFLPDLLDYFDTKQDKNLEKKAKLWTVSINGNGIIEMKKAVLFIFGNCS